MLFPYVSFINMQLKEIKIITLTNASIYQKINIFFCISLV